MGTCEDITMTRKEQKILSLLIFGIMMLVILLCAGCGSNYHLRKAIEKGAKVTSDTVYQTITVKIPEVKTDTIFKPLPGDTVTIQKDRLKIQYVKLPADSVYIFGECQPDTVKIKVPYTVTKEIKAGHGFWFDVEIVLITAIIVAILTIIFSVPVRAWLKSLL